MCLLIITHMLTYMYNSVIHSQVFVCNFFFWSENLIWSQTHNNRYMHEGYYYKKNSNKSNNSIIPWVDSRLPIHPHGSIASPKADGSPLKRDGKWIQMEGCLLAEPQAFPVWKLPPLPADSNLQLTPGMKEIPAAEQIWWWAAHFLS